MDGYDVAVACRVLKVARSGYYEWLDRSPSPRALADAYLANTIVDTHTMSRCSYGAPRVHAELRLGMGGPQMVHRGWPRDPGRHDPQKPKNRR